MFDLPGKSTAIECLKIFCQTIVKVYGNEYLRKPNESDATRLLAVAEESGFPGMMGSLDCMHWCWKNCPVADQGQYSGKEKEPTVVLEAVALYDLWIWHTFFGLPGTLNDINILDRSPIFQQLQEGEGVSVSYEVNNNQYNLGYYLTDGIYPPYATLIQLISEPQGKKKKHFAKMQEAYRKDVEQAFGVLQAWYAIIRFPGRFWKHANLSVIMLAVIILHNMTIEDEARTEFDGDFNYHQTPHTQVAITSNGPMDTTFDQFLLRYQAIRDHRSHATLQQDLIDHLWTKFGSEEANSP
jgi:hypothetical protein